MASSTRSTRQSKEDPELTHVFDIVLQDVEHAREYITGLGITKATQIRNMMKTKLKTATHNDNGTDVTISDASFNSIWAFKCYVSFKDTLSDPDERIGSDFRNADYDEYNWYCGVIFDFDKAEPQRSEVLRCQKESKEKYDAKQQPSSANTGAVSGSTTTTPPIKRSIVEEFRKTIKRDPAAFPQLKDITMFFDWYDKFTKVAEAQGVEQVLDENYSPPAGSEEESLLLEQNKYVNAVLPGVFLCPEAKQIIRMHRGKTDPRLALAELKREASQSTKASHTMNRILQDITNMNWSTTKIRTARGFIENVYNQLELYNLIAEGKNAKLPEDTMKSRLIQAVADHPELHNVTLNDNAATVRGLPPTTYQQYYTLLLDAADLYDQKQMDKHRGKDSQRKVFVHDCEFDVDIEDDDELDMTVREFLANRATARVTADGKIRMDHKVWRTLSPAGQETWDQLSEEDKAAILQFQPSTGAKATPRPSFAKRKSQRQANVHNATTNGSFDDISVNLSDFIAFVHSVQSGTNDDESSGISFLIRESERIEKTNRRKSTDQGLFLLIQEQHCCRELT